MVLTFFFFLVRSENLKIRMKMALYPQYFHYCRRTYSLRLYQLSSMSSSSLPSSVFFGFIIIAIVSPISSPFSSSSSLSGWSSTSSSISSTSFSYPDQRESIFPWVLIRREKLGEEERTHGIP